MLTVTQLTGFSAPGRQAADSLSGVAALVFAAVGLLNPDLTGTAGLAFSATASLATGAALSGAAGMSLGGAAGLATGAALSATPGITLDSAADLAVSAALGGTAAVSLNAAGSVSGLAGAAAMTFACPADLRISAALSGTSGISLAAAADLRISEPLAGSPGIALGTTGEVELGDISDADFFLKLNSNLNDATANARHFTYYEGGSGSGYTTGKVGNGANFTDTVYMNGSAQSFKRADEAAVRLVDDWTLAMEIYPNVNGSWQPGLFTKIALVGGEFASQIDGPSAQLVYDSGAAKFALKFESRVDNVVVESHTFAADISPSAWNHIALSKAGTDLHYWRNGVLVETASAVVSDPLPDNPAMPLRFGTNWTNTAFYGVMDCIGKWPRKLVDAEVRGLFNNGNGKEPTF